MGSCLSRGLRADRACPIVSFGAEIDTSPLTPAYGAPPRAAGPRGRHRRIPPLSASPPLPEPDAARLGLLYAVVFVEIGIAMPFMPIWLNALGLDARVIGLLLALPIAVRIVATAPLMALIDRGIGARRLLAAASIVLALTYGLMPAAAGLGAAALAAVIVLNAVAGAPLVPSIDYLTLAAVRRSARLDYARIRLAGSVGFLAANLAGGALLGVLGERFAVPVLLTALACVAAAVAGRGRGEAEPRQVRAPNGTGPRLPGTLVLSIAAAALIQSSHAAIYAFGSIAWSTGGVPAGWIGGLWALGVAAEIALFAGVGRLPAGWRTPFRLIALGGGAAVLRAVGLALAGDRLVALAGLQLLHALTFGATQLGAMAAVSRFAPDGARGRAQGTLSAASALASASATLACGAIYREAGGPATFLAMAPLALAGLGFAALAARRARRDDTVWSR